METKNQLVDVGNLMAFDCAHQFSSLPSSRFSNFYCYIFIYSERSFGVPWKAELVGWANLP